MGLRTTRSARQPTMSPLAGGAARTGSAEARSWLPAAGVLALLVAGPLVPGCSPTLASDDDEAERIVRLLDLRPDASVADVGAGDGEWAEVLMMHLGPAGRLFVTEVEQDLVDELRETLAGDPETPGGVRVEAVLGDQERTGLPANCCDAVLLRMVYHHFEDPATMRADLRRALRPNGRLLVIDIEPQEDWRHLEGVPDRGGHGIPLDSLVQELGEDGFRVLSTHPRWNGEDDRFAVLFEAGPTTSTRP